MQVKRNKKEIEKSEYVRQSELAELGGVRPSTIKYYSELGLLPYKQHGKGLSKFYHREKNLKRLERILELKEEGKSINEIVAEFVI